MALSTRNLGRRLLTVAQRGHNLPASSHLCCATVASSGSSTKALTSTVMPVRVQIRGMANPMQQKAQKALKGPKEAAPKAADKAVAGGKRHEKLAMEAAFAQDKAKSQDQKDRLEKFLREMFRPAPAYKEDRTPEELERDFAIGVEFNRRSGARWWAHQREIYGKLDRQWAAINSLPHHLREAALQEDLTPYPLTIPVMTEYAEPRPPKKKNLETEYVMDDNANVVRKKRWETYAGESSKLTPEQEAALQMEKPPESGYYEMPESEVIKKRVEMLHRRRNPVKYSRKLEARQKALAAKAASAETTVAGGAAAAATPAPAK